MSDNFKTIHIPQDEKPVIRTQYDELNDKIEDLRNYVQMRVDIIEENVRCNAKMSIYNMLQLLILVFMTMLNIFFYGTYVGAVISLVCLIPMIYLLYKLKEERRKSEKKLGEIHYKYVNKEK